jgi:prepilin-type N-terminal cleavage/methylation domain-containing protein
MTKLNLFKKVFNQKKPKGFSLIELSVVILVISFLIIEAITFFSGSTLSDKSSASNYRVKVIYSAIKTFVTQNRRLPCPADLSQVKAVSVSYGVEGDCNGSYTSGDLVYGMVPVKALGLGNEMAEDGYGTKFIYVVDKTFTVASDPSPFRDNDGGIVVKKYTKVEGVDVLSDEEPNAVLAIISYGLNQSGSILANSSSINGASLDADEIDNSLGSVDANIIFQTSRSSVFDDLVFFKNKSDFLIDSQSYFLKESNVGAAASNTAGAPSLGDGSSCYLVGRAGVIDKMVDNGSDVIPCDSPNYNGQLAYTCSEASLTITSSTCGCVTGYSSADSCASCSSGYNMVEGICHKKCMAQGIEGVNSVQVDAGSSTLPCNADGYNPVDTISYTCLNGEFEYTGSCGSCAAGYSSYNSTCQPNCSTGAITGINPRSVNAGFGELNCNVTGYSPADSVSYSCLEGTFAITGGTSCNVCDTGYDFYNSLCQGPCDISIVGVSATTVNAGSSSITCDKPNFTGSVNYTCSNTTPRFSSTGSCSCASGYSLVSGACQKDCSVSVTGSSTTSIAYGSGNISCNQTRYTGTVPYSCTGTETITGACACDTGYTGTNCASCATGYAMVGGVCRKECAVSITGSTTTKVNYGTGNITCNSFGYTGSIAYNCSTGNNITGTCSCATGYTGTNCASCASGYSMVSGTCQKQCSVSVTGVSTTTVSSGSSTLTCNQTGYSGTISYTCSNGSFSTGQTCNCASGYDRVGGVCVLYVKPTCTPSGSYTEISSSTRKIYRFTANGSLNCTAGDMKNFDVLVVGGGGSGGSHSCSADAGCYSTGGGGGGGVVYISGTTLSLANYSISVGNGGGSVIKANGNTGSNSTFSGGGKSITAYGGGRGSGYGGSGGGSGGSGGGGHNGHGGGSSSKGTQSGFSNGTISVYGNSGGSSIRSGTSAAGGGGGGASASGSSGSAGKGGNGGQGISISITGSGVVYGSGGGGTGYSNYGSGGSNGGGGANSNATSGVANTGGGGGASRSGSSGAGGKGVVIISYPK